MCAGPFCVGCSPGSLRRTKPPSRHRLFFECSFSLSLFSCLKRLNRGKKCNIHVIHLSSLDWKFLFLCQRTLEQFAGKIIKMKIAYILKSLFLWFLTRPKWTVTCSLEVTPRINNLQVYSKPMNCLWREQKEAAQNPAMGRTEAAQGWSLRWARAQEAVVVLKLGSWRGCRGRRTRCPGERTEAW